MEKEFKSLLKRKSILNPDKIHMLKKIGILGNLSLDLSKAMEHKLQIMDSMLGSGKKV
jgi:hypothetical protein